MRTPDELMAFAALGGIVALTSLWTIRRWRRGAHPPDPAARLLAGLALTGLGWMTGAGRWSWIPERYGVWFWGPFAAAVALFVVDWVRERSGPGRHRRPAPDREPGPVSRPAGGPSGSSIPGRPRSGP